MACSSAPIPGNGHNDEDDDIYKQIDNYKPNFKETIEKSLTNMNIHIAEVANQNEALIKSYKEVNNNFLKQQECFMLEIGMIRKDMVTLRKAIRDYMNMDDEEDEEDD